MSAESSWKGEKDEVEGRINKDGGASLSCLTGQRIRDESMKWKMTTGLKEIARARGGRIEGEENRKVG